MTALIEPIKTGYTIHFNTCGLTDEEADMLWKALCPTKIKKYLELTGHNLLVWENAGLCVEVHYCHGDNISIRCGKITE